MSENSKPKNFLRLSLLIRLWLLPAVFACLPSVPLRPAETARPGASPESAPPFLRVQGGDILDSGGRAIFLRGVNMDTYYYAFPWDSSAPQTYASPEDIRLLQELGVNVIRLALHWRYFETSLGYDLIDSYLDWCEQAGIYVILDMHVVPPEEDIFQYGIWDDSAAQERLIALWKEIAARYADRAMLAGYDLFNEPAPPRADQWWDLAERIAAAIRTVDAHHILFVEAPLTEDGGLRLIADPNVVYSFHDYEPFIVTHAGAEWVGDSPVPSDNAYPGPVLTGLEWANWSHDAAIFSDRTSGWLYWDSGTLTAPTGAEFATLRLAAEGRVGTVWFDDLELEYNGAPQTLFNPGMEDTSADHPSHAANWTFWSDSGFTGAWSGEQAHSGRRSLQISGDGDGFAVWTQAHWIFTRPLFRVQAGDTFRVRGWLYAPQNNGGSVMLGLDYYNGVYEHYDRARLLADMQPFLDWGAANDVPLYVGEFGAMPNAPGDSRWQWIADKIGAMNAAGLHWTLWTYRDNDPLHPSFGLFHGAEMDLRLAEILRAVLVEIK